jgi:hypothetical protein
MTPTRTSFVKTVIMPRGLRTANFEPNTLNRRRKFRHRQVAWETTQTCDSRIDAESAHLSPVALGRIRPDVRQYQA